MVIYGIPPAFRGGDHLFINNRHTPSGQSRVDRATQFRIDNVHCRESAVTGPVNLNVVLGVLGSRCLTGSALLDCHALKRFGIYIIGILNSLSGVWKPFTGTRHVTSTCNLSSII